MQCDAILPAVGACVRCLHLACGRTCQGGGGGGGAKRKKTCVPRLWSNMEEEAVGLLPRLHAFLDSEGSVEAPYALLRRC